MLRRDQNRLPSRVAVITIDDVEKSSTGKTRPLNVFLPSEYAVVSDRGDGVIYVDDGQGEEQWRPISY